MPSEGMHFACGDNTEASPLCGGLCGCYEGRFQKKLLNRRNYAYILILKLQSNKVI